VLLLLAWPAAAQRGESDGVRFEKQRAVVVFERGRLSEAQMERFAGLVDRGIRDVERYLGQAPSARRIRFFVGSRVSMSRTVRRTVLLPLERVKNDTAPYLHETVHVLAPPRCDCLWLGEGFASFVQSHVAEELGGYDGFVFSRGGNASVDRLARR
jgi:hypothetical protein